MTARLLIKNAAQLITMSGYSDRPAIKEKMSQIGLIENGAVYIEDGIIVEVGASNEMVAKYKDLLALTE
ncbi:hypothetical protein R0J90_23065, partial [Micrococcus sp. SIMBA_144]